MTTKLRTRMVLIGLVLGLAACSVPDGPVDVHDPYETRNRKVHEFNKGLDRAVVRPVARAYGTAVPQPVRGGVSNLADYLDTPKYILNDIAQGNVGDAAHNTFRFAFNTVFGLGVLDPATDAGLERRATGFGETLHVWGAPEGAYLETPVFGPSTERDAAGRIVDIVTNPVSYVLEDDAAYVPTVAGALSGLNARYEFGDTIDSILYESADSYAQSRSIYLQNRRFELGQETDDFEFDPYEDFE